LLLWDETRSIEFKKKNFTTKNTKTTKEELETSSLQGFTIFHLFVFFVSSWFYFLEDYRCLVAIIALRMKTHISFFLAFFLWVVVLTSGCVQRVSKPHADVDTHAAAVPSPFATSVVPTAKVSAPTATTARVTSVKAASIVPATMAARLRAELRKTPRYDQPREALEYYRLKRLPSGETQLPVEKYLTAKEQIEAMPRYSSAQNLLLPSRNEMRAKKTATSLEALGTWEALGPGNIGGRTRALLIHPTTPNVMYAAGVAGGVWRSTNAGGSWQPLTDLLPNIAVSALAFEPGNPNVIYAGTGEGYFNYNSIRGAGIFKTMDGGNSWQQLSGTMTADFYYVNDIVVSPNNAQRVYAATGEGIFRSTDGGVSWTRTLDLSNLTGGALDLAIRTDKQTDYVFAACGTFEQATIYRNTDAAGAGTWEAVLTEPGMGRTSLALAPSNQNVIYALAASYFSGPYEDGLHAVFRSTSSGDANTWTKQTQNTDPSYLNTLLLSNPLAATLRDCGYPGQNEIYSQGWYDNVIAVDPADENKVWAGGIDLFRSDDGGRNWGLASHWWASKTAAQYAHADHHVIAFHPQYNGTTNKQMFIGTDGGLFRTNDARAAVATGALAPCNPTNSQVAWQSLNNGYAVTQFYHGAVAPDGKSYLGGTQDNGTVRSTDAKGANGWEEILGGDGGFAAFDPTNPNIIYASFAGGRVYKSTDGGATFGQAEFGLNDTARFFVTPLVMDPSDPQRLWTGGNQIWRSDKGAAQWRRVINATNVRATAIAVSPSDANYVLVGGTVQGILRTSNALLADSNTSWQTATPRQGFVSGLAFDPTNPEIAYATYSTFGGAHVWKTMDGGASWSSIDGFGAGALPDIPVNCIVVDPTNPVRLFIGTDLGVFVSTNGGAAWNVENTGFANAPVEALSLNTTGGVTTLYAFTHGRGAWRITLGSGCQTVLTNATRTVAQSGATGTIVVTSDCNVTATVNPSGAGWLMITSISNSSVGYSVAANTGNTARSGTITINGRSFSIIQPNRIGTFGNADTTAPTITITTPDPAQIFKSTSRFITVRGTASDDQGVVELYAINERTGVRSTLSLPNAGTWEAVIGISFGVNPLTIYARDAAGNLSSARFSASYSVPRTIISIAGAGPPLSFGQFGGDGGPSSAAFISGPSGIVIDAAGNVLFVDRGNQRVRKIDSNGIITTIVGNGAAGFSGDGGLAINASLNNPQNLALDRVGNLYIADEGNRRVRKVTPQGIISTVAGNGNASSTVMGDDGPATQAELARPLAVAVDAAGDLYIGDFDLQRIRKVTIATGIITTVAGAGASGSTEEGAPALTASIGSVTDLVFDRAGNLFFSQNGSPSSRVKKISTDGKVTTFSNVISARGLAIDKDDNLYVVSFTGSAVFRVAPDGTSTMVAGGGSSGSINEIGDGGPPLEAVFRQPIKVAVDAAGSLYISDSLNNRLRKVFDTPTTDSVAPIIAITGPTSGLTSTTNLARLRWTGSSSDNVFVTHVTWSNNRGGSGVCVGTGGWATSAFNPFPLSPPPDPQLFPGLNVLTFTAWDLAGNSRSVSITVNFNPLQTATNFAGNLSSGYSGDSATSSSAQLWSPENVTTDASGNLYIADRGNHVIRKVTPDGVITTFAGTGQLGSSGDGGPATAATFNEPTGLAFDATGNLYIADANNHRIRKITPQGIISTVVGNGTDEFAGDGGPATQASLNLPIAVTFDKAGNLYITDTLNNRIRKVTTNGAIQSIAGVTLNGYTGDGGLATQAQLNFPTGVVVDDAGNVFIADTSNHRVRKINTSGIISTVMGTGSAGYSGDEGPAVNAVLNAPGGLALDAAGNLYIADQYNHCIRRLSTDGKASTAVGSGTQGAGNGSGDATSIQLNAPAGVAFDRAGNLFIADTNNHRVVKVQTYNSITSVSAASYRSNRPVAPDTIVSAFGPRLALSTKAVTTPPLPTSLDGAKVIVKDSDGIERLASLFFVSPLQVNYLMPTGTALGIATITLTINDVVVASEAIQIVASEPSLFTASQNGSGVAAASILYFRNGVPRYESGFACDAQGQNCVARQIDLNAGDEVYLELYGTGIRNNSGLTNVTVTVGGEAVPVLYANKQPDFVGLDQVNIRIPKPFAGRGEVDVVLTVDGKMANTVKINLK
jgi:uncharacterized protein (TIGR03437 family)